MTPPTDHNAELSLLGATFLACSQNPEKAAEVFSTTTASHFFHPPHQILFDVLREMWQASKSVDGVTLTAELRRRGLYDEVGGRDLLIEMSNSVPSWNDADQYAAIVRELATRRQIMDLCAKGLSQSENPAGQVAAEVASSLGAQLAMLGAESAAVRYVEGKRLAELCWQEQTEKNDTRSITTGWADFPRIRPGKFYIIAGRPSMGKSAWAKCLILELLKRGIPVGMAVPDETKTKVGNDLACSIASVSVSDADAKTLGESGQQAFCQALGSVAQFPLYLDDECSSIEELEALAALWKARHGIRVLYVDYIGLLGTKEREAQSTTARVTVIARRLKALFRRLDVVGIAISQLSRANANREDKRPTLTDLRESGELESVADAVLALHRESYYQHETGQATAEDDYTEVWVLKDKTGARMRAFVMRAVFENMRFMPLQNDEQRSYWRMMHGDRQ